MTTATDPTVDPTVQTFRLPDVGEGLTEAEIVTWHVSVGDTVAVNQTIVDIETAKSVVELPSPYAGEVAELFFAEGDTVDVGSPIIAVRSAVRTIAVPAPDDQEPKLLVGYGAKETDGAGPSRRRRGVSVALAAEPAAAADAPRRERPRAKPPVRKLAKDFGVDLSRAEPTGQRGTVVRADVLRAAEIVRAAEIARAAESARATRDLGAAAVSPERTETRIPIKGVRKHTAAAMVASAFSAPHVTESVTVDITKALELREVVQRRREFQGVKLSPLAFVARSYLHALARTPARDAGRRPARCVQPLGGARRIRPRRDRGHRPP